MRAAPPRPADAWDVPPQAAQAAFRAAGHPAAGAQLPAWSGEHGDASFASMLGKIAEALPQAASGRIMYQAMPEKRTSAGSPPERKFPLPPGYEQAVTRAVEAIMHKMLAASVLLERLEVDDPQCDLALAVVQTCALTLSLLTDSLTASRAAAVSLASKLGP